jgi:hypothetical protein
MDVENSEAFSVSGLTAQFLAPTRPKTTAVNATMMSWSGAQMIRLRSGRSLLA